MKWWLVFATLWVCGCAADVPEQPLPFSHAIHAGQQAIACTRCHAGAERGVSAQLPSIAVCMSCHMRPQGSATPPRDQAVRERSAKRGPFRWVQVTRNPGHVYFSHRAHVTFGEMGCDRCHGEVATWAETPRSPEGKLVDMDACMTCHRERKASNECDTCHR